MWQAHLAMGLSLLENGSVALCHWLRHPYSWLTKSYSHRWWQQHSVPIVAIWKHVGESVVLTCLFFKRLFWGLVLFSVFCFPPSSLPFFFPLLSLCVPRYVIMCAHCCHYLCPDIPVWKLMTGLPGFLTMGAFFCLGAGWSQWRPLDIPGIHLPLSLIQLLNDIKWIDDNPFHYFTSFQASLNNLTIG